MCRPGSREVRLFGNLLEPVDMVDIRTRARFYGTKDR